MFNNDTKQLDDKCIEFSINKINILKCINQYIPLEKSGANYKGLCPFHKQKTPSFLVSPEKQIYHCFGCCDGGNVISFIKRYKDMNESEALTFIYENYLNWVF